MTAALLPTGSTQPPPIGRIEDGRIDADNLSTRDTEFLAEAESAPDQFVLGRLCQEAFELGVAVWRYARSTSEMLTVRDHLQGFEKGVEEAATTAVATLRDELVTMVDPDQGAIAAAVSREMVKLSQTVEAAFDNNDKTSALSRIEESVEEITSEMMHEATRRVSALLDPNHDDSPLGALRSQIVREVSAPLAERVGGPVRPKQDTSSTMCTDLPAARNLPHLRQLLQEPLLFVEPYSVYLRGRLQKPLDCLVKSIENSVVRSIVQGTNSAV